MKKVDRINEEILSVVTSKHGNETTTNIQLDEICGKLFGTRYLGTVPSDQIPSVRSEGDMFICNVDRAGMTGSHWLGVYCLDKKKMLVYDSFGRKSSKLIPNMYNKYKLIDTENDQEQPNAALNCGQRSVTFLLICKYFGPELAKQL